MDDEIMDEFNSGDKVYISHCDIDACGYGDSVNTNGVVIGSCNGLVSVAFIEENFWQPTSREFYPHELKKIT